MNKDKIIIISVILNLLLVAICLICLNSSTNIVLGYGKQIIKEMTEGEYESKITELNISHKDYALQVQTNKQKLATAISNQKVATSENATIDEMITNIGKIFEERTRIDDSIAAMADNIIEGKQAYVNGNLITGTLSSTGNYGSYGILTGIRFASPSSTDEAGIFLTYDVSNYSSCKIEYVKRAQIKYSIDDGTLTTLSTPTAQTDYYIDVSDASKLSFSIYIDPLKTYGYVDSITFE